LVGQTESSIGCRSILRSQIGRKRADVLFAVFNGVIALKFLFVEEVRVDEEAG
jgi:hypothetical protein